MSALSFGGATVVDAEITRSWGLSPGSATITAVGVYSVTAGDDVVFSLGGLNFYGIVSRVVDEIQEGVRTRFELVDNRIKLMWDDVFCLFNRIEVRPDNPATPGIDRQKRYLHILPDNWATQTKTYTDEPYTAAEIIPMLFGAPTVDNAWAGTFHGAQSSPVREVDALGGKKLGNVLQEITEAQGLVFTLDGPSTLRWTRKGDDTAPSIDAANQDQRSIGNAISSVDTQISVVGDRNRYQDINIDLEFDWNEAYEEFWNEPDWLDEVGTVFDITGDDFATRARRAAKARKVTLREYVAAKGNPSLADYGMWWEVSRMEIPVWTYLHDIVYKAYRVPRDYSFNGIPVQSLELVEGLLCSVASDLDGDMTYDTSENGGYYPDAKAFVVVQGQQLSLLDPNKQRMITTEELNNEATEFAPNNRYNIDTRNKTIIFEDPVFLPNDLFIFPNHEADVVDSMKGIAVPNAEAAVSPADVKASLVWEAERYRMVYGSGPRKGVHDVSGLARHKLFDGASDQGEISYADDETADQKAQAIAASLIAQQSIYAAGGFRIVGGYGTELNGSIDRVTTSITFPDGVNERVEFSKERAQSNFENERDLERKQRSRDLFPGQRDLRDTVQTLDLISRVSKELKRSPLDPVYTTLSSVMEKPVGAEDCSVVKIYDASGEPWDAGFPVFLDKNDAPSDTGQRFGGIVIADQSRNILNCATQGTVPVVVKGPFRTNDIVGIDDGADEDPKVGGDKLIGQIQSPGYAGTDTVLAMVHLGRGTEQTETPFQVIEVIDPDADPDDPDAPILVGVISNSHVLNSEDRDTYEEDNSDWGLLDDDNSPATAFPVGDIGDKIWLEIKLNRDQSIAEINVRHGPVGEGNLWEEYPDPIAINVDDPGSPYQEYYNQIIAEITDPDEDPRPGFGGKNESGAAVQVTQLLFTNLEMTTGHTTKDADEPELPLLVPVPGDSRPGTATDGSADPIPSDDDIMTPWAFGDLVDDETPFQVVTRKNGDNYEIGVISNSHLFNSEDRDTHEEDNAGWGLLTDDRSSGWVPLGDIGDKVWLEIKLNKGDQSIAEINVRFGSVGGAGLWDEYPDPIAVNVDDPAEPFQEYYNQIIAEITDPEEDPRAGLTINKGTDESPDNVQLTQLLFTDLMMTPAHTTKDADEPDLPLSVALPWRTLPGTSTDGAADEINSEDDLMTPWILGVIAEDNRYSFELLDASDNEGPKVRLIDGEFNGHLPPGMGGDDYILNLINNDESDPDSNGENDIYLEVTYEPDGSVSSLSLNVVAPDDLPVSKYGDLIVKLGYALVAKTYAEVTGDPIYKVSVHNTVAGDIHVDLAPLEKYGFQMFDATDDEGTKVLIMDGKVNGIDGTDHVPTGMGNDDYILPVQDDWDIWLDIPYDPGTFLIIDPVTINAGEEMPDDTEEGGVAHSYVQIGYVDVEQPDTGDPETPANAIPQVVPHNTVCGDYDFKKPEERNVYSFKLLDASTGSSARVRVLDGNVIDEDGDEHTPEGMGEDEFVREVEDDDVIYLAIFYNRATREIIEPVTVGVGEMPDDTEGVTYVEIGYVNVETDGDKATVTPHNTHCGDYTLLIEDEPLYAFQIFDASETSPPGGPTYKVRLVDGNVIDRNGNEFTPEGMGSDAFTIDVADEEEIYLDIPRDADWNVAGTVTIAHGSEVPNDTDDHNYVPLGYVNVAADGTLEVHNVQCGDYHFEPPPITNRYSFELIDASDNEGAKVLIMDGQVFGPNDDGTLPDGMGGDNYILGVDDGDEIYLVIVVDNESNDVTSVTIGQGTETPDDSETEESSTIYVTIGYISVDFSGEIPVVNATNALCGDYELQRPLDVAAPDEDGVERNFSDIDKLTFVGAVSVPSDTVEGATEIELAIGPDIADDTGDFVVDNPRRIVFTTDPAEDPSIVVEEGEDEFEALVHIGQTLDVLDAINENEVDGVTRLTFSHALPEGDDPDNIVDDNGDGEAVVHLLKLDVASADGGPGVTGVQQITFTREPPGDDGFLVEEGDLPLEALVHMLGIDVADDVDNEVDGVQRISFTHERPADADTIVQDNGEQDALVYIPSLTVADDDGNDADGVDYIEFIGYAETVVTDDGEGGTTVQILPDLELDEDGADSVLTTDGSDVFWGQAGGIDVVDETGGVAMDQVKSIHFTLGATSDPTTIVEDNGGGEALVHIRSFDVVDDTGGPALNDILQFTFDNEWSETIVTEGGEHEAIIHIPSFGVGDDDGAEVDNVDFIEFIGYSGQTVQDDGGGGVTVQILPDPDTGGSEEGVLTTDGNDVYWSSGFDFGSDEFYNAVTEAVYNFVRDGGIDDLITDGRYAEYIGLEIQDWFDNGNFDIEDWVEDIDLDVCEDGDFSTVTVFGPLGS